MVCEWGMADEMGPIAYGQEDEPIFLGKEIARRKDYSEDTAERLDNAIKSILDKAKEEAERIIMEKRDELDKLTDALMSRETLVDDEVRELLGLPPRENSNSLLSSSHKNEVVEAIGTTVDSAEEVPANKN
jgi:cell division protease FtsH